MANKKKKTSLYWLLATMILLAILYFVLHYYKAEKEESVEDADSVTLYTADEDQITQIHYVWEEKEITLVKQDENWQFDKDSSCEVNQTLVQSMISSLKSITSTRTIADSQENQKEYGLEEPCLMVTVTLLDGSSTTIRVGMESLTKESGYYGTVDGKEGIYLLSTGFYTSFCYDKLDLANKESLPTVDSTNLKKLFVKQGDQTTMELVYDEDKKDTANGPWKLQVPYNGEIFVPEDMISSLLEPYCSLTFTEMVTNDCEDASQYGLTTPSRTITMEYEEDSIIKEYTIMIGTKDEDGNYYARVGEGNTIYLLANSSVTDIEDLKLVDYLDPYVSMCSIDTVNSIIFNANGQEHQYVITRGSDDQVTYTLNGVNLEEAEGKALFSKVIALEIVGEKTKDSDKQELILDYTITRTSDENDPTHVEFYSYDDSYDSVKVDGVEYFLVDKRDVEALKKVVE